MIDQKNIVFALGNPYGAPMAWIRGGGTRDQQVRDFLKSEESQCSYWWNSGKHGWETVRVEMWDTDFLADLRALKTMGYNVKPKEGNKAESLERYSEFWVNANGRT